MVHRCRAVVSNLVTEPISRTIHSSCPTHVVLCHTNLLLIIILIIIGSSCSSSSSSKLSLAVAQVLDIQWESNSLIHKPSSNHTHHAWSVNTS